MTPAEKIKDLLCEGDLVCAFYDRSTFYANAAGANPPQARYLSLLARAESIESKLSGSPIDIVNGESICIYFLNDFNRAYVAAMDMLDLRFKDVFERYRSQRRGPLWWIIRFADRNINFTQQCACDLLQKSQNVTTPIRNALDNAINTGSPAAIPSNEWKLVRENGEVLMEEISFLGGRVDHINSLRNSILALLSGLVALIATNTLHFDTKGNLFGIINKPDTPEAILEQTKELDKSLKQIKDAIGSQTGPTVVLVEQQISTLQHTLDTNTAHTPDDIRELRTKIDALSTSLAELKSLTESKKTPTVIINNSPSSAPPPPEQKGFININSR